MASPERPRGRRRRGGEPTSIGEVLAVSARSVGITPVLAALLSDDELWRRTVGADLAESGRPVRCTDGELVIAARDSVGATRLRYAAEALRQAVNEHIGRPEVRAVVVRRP